MSPAEQRARRLLVAYPWRVRAERGDEIVGTVLDGQPPGSDRLRWRDQVDLVRGGLRVRNQRRPPWLTVMAYNTILRIGPQWLGWVLDDLDHPAYRWSKTRHAVLWYVPGAAVIAVVTQDPMVLVFGALLVVGTPLVAEHDRAQKRARYGLAPGGRDPRFLWVARRAQPALPNLGVGRVLAAGGLSVATGAALCVLAVAHHDPLDGVGRAGPAPSNVVSRMVGPGLAGGAAGLVVLAVGVLVAVSVGRRRARHATPPVPIAAPVATLLVCVGTAGVAATCGALLALGFSDQDSAWQGAMRAATIAPIALAVGLVGVVLLVVGWARGGPVGLWEVLPRTGVRDQTLPLARRFVDPARDRPVWEADVTDGAPGPG